MLCQNIPLGISLGLALLSCAALRKMFNLISVSSNLQETKTIDKNLQRLKKKDKIIFLSVEKYYCHAMKVAALLIAILNIASVYSLIRTPFEVRKVLEKAIYTGLVPRVYNGMEAKEGQFPYMIFTIMNTHWDISSCSASLISPSWVLLAAHCVNFPGLTSEDIILVGGKANLSDYITMRLKMDYYTPVDEAMFGLQERRAKAFFHHPHYDEDNLVHDVGLIQLNKPFILGAIKTIPLSKDKIKQSKQCRILGWGLTRGNLQTYKLNFIENKKVSTTDMGCLYKDRGAFICLEPDNRGICQGDSGSPLVCEDMVWGVASHYVSDKSDCGNSLEEYYSELYADLDWIHRVLKGGNSMAVVSLKGLLLCVLAVMGHSWKFGL